MKKYCIGIAAIVFFIFVYNISFAEIRVLSVKGKVAYKSKMQWKQLENGMILNEGTKISTGIRSSAVIRIDRHKLTVRPLTMMKIYRNRVTKKSSITKIGLRYGRLRARVKRIKRLKTMFKIATPVATSSVRGTEQEVFYGPKIGMIVKVFEGVIDAETPHGARRSITGRSVFHQKADRIKSERLLKDVKNNSIVKLFDDNITDDEKSFHDVYGDEGYDNSDMAHDDPDINLRRRSGANVHCNWPQ